MSFIEFLVKYYVYIFAVLVVLIIGVIGFLVDSRNKEKKKKMENVQGNNDMSNTEPLEQPSMQNMSVNNVQSDVQLGIQPGIQQPQMINNDVSGNMDLNNVMPSMVDVPNVNDGLSDVNGLNNVNNVQPVMPNLEVNPLSEIPVNNSKTMNNNMNQDGMIDVNSLNDVNNVQSVMPNIDVNPIPVQPIQPQVNQEFNQVPVSNVNVGMASMLNKEPEVNVVPNVQPVIQPTAATIEPISFNSVSPVINNEINTNFNNQNQMMGVPSVQPQATMESPQPIMSNNSQVGVIPNLNNQNTNITTPSNNNGSVVTSDGSQPFDISSMFANNQ